MTQFTIPEGAGSQILSYVRTKAPQWTNAEMVERVKAALAQLEAAARAVPAELLTMVPPSEQDWTPLQCITHVAGINMNTATRCAAVASTGRLPDGPSPAAPEDREGALSLQRVTLDAVFEAVSAAPEGARPEAAWEHPLLGPLDWREWFLTLRVHSLGHADQLNQMRQSFGG
ncbi:MAG: hypothetical protein ACKVVT_04765 [Dehalococcoidia bacterium]